MSAGASVARFAMKRGATPSPKAIASAEIAVKLRVRFRPISLLPGEFGARQWSKRDTRSRSRYAGGTPCATIARRCGGLVFGGIFGRDSNHTIYAGSLDEPALFHPTIALFLARQTGLGPAAGGPHHI